MSTPESIASTRPAHRGGVGAVRFAVLLGPLIFATYVVSLGISAEDEVRRLACGPPIHSAIEGVRIVGVLVALAASAPIYLYILWNLAGPRYKRGLALALATGLIALVISGASLATLPLIVIFLPFLEYGIYESLSRPLLSLLGLKPIPVDTFLAVMTFRIPLLAGFVLSQGLLLWLAIRTYRREAGDGRMLIQGFAKAALSLGWFLALFTVSISLLMQPFPRDVQVDKIAGLLRLIQRSEETYLNTYKHGYSPMLAALGPPPAGAPASASALGLIDKTLSSGNMEGYRFDYRPESLLGGMIDKYVIDARPNKQCTGPCCCNLRAFSTGSIDMTNQDSHASAGYYDTPLKQEPIIMGLP